VQIIFTGAASNVGFAWMPTDILLSDAIMQSGGPGNNADILATVVKRGSKELWPKEQVRVALREGMTLDQLNMRAGDEIAIGTVATAKDWRQRIWIVTASLSLIYAIKRAVP
jgi:hypothetical protein